jgi:hypothetical protein
LPLCLLFNRSLASCVFPDRWKLSFVTPILKSGQRNDVSNYRGISIMWTVGKLFELLVYKYMYEDLKGQLMDCQHGFVKGRSTVSNLLEYSSFVLKSIEDGSADSIYTDSSKAFDKVRHRLLLDKMSTDVEPSRCQWLGSYFSGRIQCIKMGDCVSKDILVTSGVPLGSHEPDLC